MKDVATYLDDAWQPYPDEWPAAGLPHVPKAQAERALQAALNDAAALQAFFDARDKELCQAFDSFRQQVATELAGLLWPEPADNPTELRIARACNETLKCLAARLGIDLSTPAAPTP